MRCQFTLTVLGAGTSSGDVSGFYDFPMPRHFGDYPTRAQILGCTRDFADTFGLRHRLILSEVHQALTDVTSTHRSVDRISDDDRRRRTLAVPVAISPIRLYGVTVHGRVLVHGAVCPAQWKPSQ